MARVLLVEGDIDARALMEHIICAEGHLVVTSETVAQAIALLGGNRFDLVVTDVNLRDGNGLRVADLAQQNGMRALVVTGCGVSPNPALSAGYDYLSKPLGGTALIEAIRRRLPCENREPLRRAVPKPLRAAKQSVQDSGNGVSSPSGIAASAVERDRRQAERHLVSTLSNRNVTVSGRRTSMRLEPSMWDALRQVCDRERMTLSQLVTEVDRQRSASSLTAAIRVYLLQYFYAAATDEGHRLAGHRVLYPSPRSAMQPSPQ